ncbi:chemotaxis-specific protein-glutamate methyltransferase CheB [Solirubrobacter sp. CPCC 204708]|uniref:Protein-glutamate methylesterase/protein-glutamine glutaminase n=1 Tax=Solirubrobacter deserti TaxID=2282478 RepID=A0ABT4RH02_9ACTN|nr:chemotaxis-specific protein-glutamate methyltransferase CheB [Solirubrobacter deserti]MBE2315331.1 chemotaxis-specific protein-glutamate methyltransferase CheB [Solirubrobacter deserti]MDA0137824.1 chemotaxis-specific protein-glutamate methyltransferase CheB [Solirubrobacter deserti]
MASLLNTNARPRVVVADDSRLMRRILSDALGRQGFEVVAAAADGDEALAACNQHRPDAMTLDLHMPGLDGLGVLRALKAGKATSVPVIVVSAFSPAHGARAVDALAEGAFDLVAKPAMGESMDEFTKELAKKVNDAADSGKARARRRVAPVTPLAAKPAAPVTPVASRAAVRPRPGKKFVMIASSTGGPKALGELIPKLPSPLGSGSVIVQHMPPGFTASLATRLDGTSPLNVIEAKAGDAVDAKRLLLAPGGAHLRMEADGRVRLSDDAPMGGLRPRADLTIADVAKIYGPSLLLVVLTGMGKDGLEGAKAVKAAGGRILVEAESTCVVYGMPRAVAEAGLADEILPLHDLPAAIAREAGA